jgi:hypothetical protein
MMQTLDDDIKYTIVKFFRAMCAIIYTVSVFSDSQCVGVFIIFLYFVLCVLLLSHSFKLCNIFLY